MAVVNKISKEPVEVMYVSPPDGVLFKEYSILINKFYDYAKANHIDRESIKINDKLLGDILVRVDKRQDYFLIYHDAHINEFKKSALIAYWIIKFHPFFILDESGEKSRLNVNEGFAAFLCLGSISEYYRRNKIEFKLSEEYRDKLMYALKYWDLSKESFMLIVETLCEKGKK